MREGGKNDAAVGDRVPEPSEEPGSAPTLRPRDTDSVYDVFLQQVASAPSVRPELLSDRVLRVQPESLAGERLAHFRVIDRLGAGGMGVVYRAEDEMLRRTVALKVLSAQLHGAQRNQWLLGEARNAAAVSHPNIAAIYEVGEAQGLAFIAMEFVGGQSLRTLLEARGLPVERAMPLALQIARGLARAHQCGIVHRDLKPDNVMVGLDGFVKILDFGLAMPLAVAREGGPEASREGASPRPGQVVGTVAYMSPEQSRGRTVDARSDLYSFGVLLFELLAGRRPRISTAREEALALSLDGVPEGLAGALRRVLARCLEPRPEDRYPDGAALVVALQALPVSRPLEVTRQASERPRRSGLPWGIAILALVVVGGVALWVLRGRGASEFHERRLTDNPPENLLVDAALSPDGQMLAYTDQTGLSVRGIDPKWMQTLGLPEAGVPLEVGWFPDGDELVVTSNEPGPRPTTRGKPEPPTEHLWRLRISTGQAHSLGVGRYLNPRVSPEGTRLAWTDHHAIRVGVLERLPDSGVVARAARDEWLDKPCWSPDGKRVAYVRVALTTASLETSSLETGAREVLLETPRLVSDLGLITLAWAASGELVFSLSDLPPKEVGFSLWRLEVEPESGKARGPRRLIHGWSGFYPDLLSVSTRGSLAMARLEAQEDVYVGELSDGGRTLSPPVRLTPSERNECPSGWSPDGKTLLFTSDGDGTTDIFLQKLDGNPAQKLEGDRDFKTWPAFTPAGDEILFWRYPCPPDELPHRAELKSLRLPSGPAAGVLTLPWDSGWTWSQSSPWTAHFRCVRGGGRCVLGEKEGDQLVFSLLDPRRGWSGELGRIEAPGTAFHGWDLSPDGQRIALPGNPGEVRELELSSGTVSLRQGVPGCQLQYMSWSADGRDLFATGDCKDALRDSKLFRIGPQGRAEVLWEQSSMRFSRPLASPDGKHLALGVKSLENAIWLVTGL